MTWYQIGPQGSNTNSVIALVQISTVQNKQILLVNMLANTIEIRNLVYLAQKSVINAAFSEDFTRIFVGGHTLTEFKYQSATT